MNLLISPVIDRGGIIVSFKGTVKISLTGEAYFLNNIFNL